MRRAFPMIPVIPAILVLGLLSGCAPGTPDQDSWRVDGVRAVGDVSSAVATMETSLEHRDDLVNTYLRTLAVESEQSAGKASAKLASRQPPSAYLVRYHHVASALDDAQTLLADARIAIVRGDTDAYDALVEHLKKTDDQLSSIEDSLRALPDDRSNP